MSAPTYAPLFPVRPRAAVGLDRESRLIECIADRLCFHINWLPDPKDHFEGITRCQLRSCQCLRS